jgi:hypothetical protein
LPKRVDHEERRRQITGALLRVAAAKSATVSFRTESRVTENQSWPLVDSGALAGTVPWRTFRWYLSGDHAGRPW